MEGSPILITQSSPVELKSLKLWTTEDTRPSI